MLAVAHSDYGHVDLGALDQLTKATAVVYDLKYVLPRGVADIRL